jgi:hypothetical protein
MTKFPRIPRYPPLYFSSISRAMSTMRYRRLLPSKRYGTGHKASAHCLRRASADAYPSARAVHSSGIAPSAATATLLRLQNPLISRAVALMHCSSSSGDLMGSSVSARRPGAGHQLQTRCTGRCIELYSVSHGGSRLRVDKFFETIAFLRGHR